MSKIEIHELFALDAPPERVWLTLIDPARVAGCIPGATLEGPDESEEGAFRGSVRVSVGPVTVSYRGTVRFERVDHEARRLRVTGTGREATGSGSATMTMESRVEPAGEGGSGVVVDAEIQVTGKIVRFGRGMVERVSQEIFHDFTACLAAMLTRQEGVPVDGGARSAPAPGSRAPRPPDPEGPGRAPAMSAPRLLWRTLLRWVRERFAPSRRS